MLQQNNIERIFDQTLKKALPYLILSPSDFRNSLAERVNTLFALSQGGDSSITNFNECNDYILELIKNTVEFFDSITNRQIDAFDSKYKSFDERISELNERILLLEKIKYKKQVPNIAIEVKKTHNNTTEIPTNVLISTTEIPHKQLFGPKQRGKRIYHSKGEIYLLNIPTVLEYITKHGSITFLNIKDLFNFDNNQARLLLEFIKKRNLIQRDGKMLKENTKYILKIDK